MHESKLGELLKHNTGRDAVHIAIMPVVAKTTLLPGTAATMEGWTDEPGCGHGIVDPFLIENVKPGEMFWLCLYPGSITSLRHVWTHPDLVKPTVPQ